MTDPSAPHATGPRRSTAGVAAIAFLLAFLLSVAWVREGRRSDLEGARRERLAALVVARQQRAASIERELSGLRARAEALNRGDRGRAAQLQEQIAALAAFAGTAAVTGPGLVVELADSPGADQESSPDFRIQDVDVQLVVNELWAAGAEAVAVNGQRIVSTTAIRSAGQAVLVNYKVLTSPYRVAAVGNAATMKHRFESSEISERFRTWTQVYRLSIKVGVEAAVSVPAYTGSVRSRHAQPAG